MVRPQAQGGAHSCLQLLHTLVVALRVVAACARAAKEAGRGSQSVGSTRCRGGKLRCVKPQLLSTAAARYNASAATPLTLQVFPQALDQRVQLADGAGRGRAGRRAGVMGGRSRSVKSTILKRPGDTKALRTAAHTRQHHCTASRTRSS